MKRNARSQVGRKYSQSSFRIDTRIADMARKIAEDHGLSVSQVLAQAIMQANRLWCRHGFKVTEVANG